MFQITVKIAGMACGMYAQATVETVEAMAYFIYKKGGTLPGKSLEFVANIFFYTKAGVTIMIGAGYNYGCLREKMGWPDLDPAAVRHIFITHQDTDHVGAVERDSDGLFRDAILYIGEEENRYLTGEKRRRVIHGLYKLSQVIIDNPKVLLRDGQILAVGGIKIECFLIPGHTGWTDDLDFAFAHRDKVCNAYVKQRSHDPDAPYDAYDESDDTEDMARASRLPKVRKLL